MPSPRRGAGAAAGRARPPRAGPGRRGPRGPRAPPPRFAKRTISLTPPPSAAPPSPPRAPRGPFSPAGRASSRRGGATASRRRRAAPPRGSPAGRGSSRPPRASAPSGARSMTGDGEADLLLPVLPRVGGDQQVLLAQQLLEERARGEVVARLDAPPQARHHAADLVVEDELLQALAALEVEHAGAGDAVDAGEGGEHRAHAGLEPGLRVEGLRVGERDVALGRQAEALADLGVRAVEHHRLDGAHRRRLVADVEDGGRAAPDDGGARPRRAG